MAYARRFTAPPKRSPARSTCWRPAARGCSSTAGCFRGSRNCGCATGTGCRSRLERVNAVVLTHAHIDHIGYLPRFVQRRFSRAGYSTPATEALAELLLLDSAHNQEEEAEYANRKGYSKHKPALPLYDADDVKRAMSRFRTVHRDEWFSPAEPIWMRYHDTGHLLGSCDDRGRSAGAATAAAHRVLGRRGALRRAAVSRPAAAAGLRLPGLREHLRQSRSSAATTCSTSWPRWCTESIAAAA